MTFGRYNRPGFLQATAKGIATAIASLPADVQQKAHVLYTAQGLPVKYVTDLGDPYQEQVEPRRSNARPVHVHPRRDGRARAACMSTAHAHRHARGMPTRRWSAA